MISCIVFKPSLFPDQLVYIYVSVSNSLPMENNYNKNTIWSVSSHVFENTISTEGQNEEDFKK